MGKKTKQTSFNQAKSKRGAVLKGREKKKNKETEIKGIDEKTDFINSQIGKEIKEKRKEGLAQKGMHYKEKLLQKQMKKLRKKQKFEEKTIEKPFEIEVFLNEHYTTPFEFKQEQMMKSIEDVMGDNEIRGNKIIIKLGEKDESGGTVYSFYEFACNK